MTWNHNLRPVSSSILQKTCNRRFKFPDRIWIRFLVRETNISRFVVWFRYVSYISYISIPVAGFSLVKSTRPNKYLIGWCNYQKSVDVLILLGYIEPNLIPLWKYYWSTRPFNVIKDVLYFTMSYEEAKTNCHSKHDEATSIFSSMALDH